MERLLLVLSCLCLLTACGYAVYGLRVGKSRPGQFSFLAMAAAFAFQTAFLFHRGQLLERCPLTNLFEVIIFLSWSLVLLYMMIGPAYRLSLLGTFTAPMVLLFQSFALIAPIDAPGTGASPTPWLEFHAAVAIIAFGAFGLAGIAGVMYLIQERQLKTHQLRSIFFHMPPIAVLAVAMKRLMLVGFALLTAALIAGFAMGEPTSSMKIAWSVGVWSVYGLVLQAGWWKQLSPRRVALASVFAFSLTLSTLWWLHFSGEQLR
jgi:ABC-type uncharacterized transport system permease subunit